jgi:catechol 2,3-dioxygenase
MNHDLTRRTLLPLAGASSLAAAAGACAPREMERLRQAGVEVAAVANGLEAVDPWGTRVRLVKV